ncbi:MAG: helix-turn-helix transcriptional regulator [Candidatus Eremiobacteraeota bacterium]|nr:helix-turn-helix transcriptional regulator [Candidatus Eremiobacteraeota bacterium]
MRKRSKPRVVLLNEDLSIAFAEADAMAFIAAMLDFPTEKIVRLPAKLESSVEKIVQTWMRTKSIAEQVVAPLPSTILRVTQLSGPAGSFIAVFIEEHQRREDLAGAARRYALSRRELEVLTLILGGMNATEIAANMNIAETTVSDYFKHLLRKTGAKNRADMLAKVLGWSGAQDTDGQP